MLKSIKSKMMIIIGLLVVILITSCSIWLYMQSKTILMQSVKNNALQQAKGDAQAVNNWLKGIKNQFEDLSRMPIFTSMNRDLQAEPLLNLPEKHSYIKAAFVANEQG